MDPATALDRIALLMTVLGQPSFRARVFSRAAAAVRRYSSQRLKTLASAGELRRIEGIGPVVERVISESLESGRPEYLQRLEQEADEVILPGARDLLGRLRGDCHVHSNWSDGRETIEVMAAAAEGLEHEYFALTDHSPRLTIARGLTPERLREQLSVLDGLNSRPEGPRILSGIEADILQDGELDQEPELLQRLELVVGSVHSRLRQDGGEMTRRMLAAIAKPHFDILGHCTGRLITGRGRPESEFDAEAVFEACARFDKAVEINCRPERLDPPRRLLRLAVEAGCKFAISTDAHTASELHWQLLGCQRAAECDVPANDVVNTWPRQRLLAWTYGHRQGHGHD